LEKAVLERNSKSITHYAHSIKGSAKNFGANRLAGVCKQLEDLGRVNAAKGTRELLGALFAEADLVIEQLKKELQPNKADTIAQACWNAGNCVNCR